MDGQAHSSAVESPLPAYADEKRDPIQSTTYPLEKQGERVTMIKPSLTRGSSTRDVTPRAARTIQCFWTIVRFFVDLSLIVPPICFLVFIGQVVQHNGQHLDVYPVRTLLTAAKYGPTIFPIVFGASMGNLLKAYAAWKLERGITVLSLEYLLSCRSVFSTLVTPFCLRAFNMLTPLLVLVWLFSPLGGQAAFRLIEVIPSTRITPWNFTYLEYMSNKPYLGLMPPTIGAFAAALSSPKDVKTASKDAFGNIKIPLLEAFQIKAIQPGKDGWYNVLAPPQQEYSSIIGIPAKGAGDAKYTFRMETSYMYTNCSVNHIQMTDFHQSSYDYLAHHEKWNNNLTLVIQTTKRVSVARTEPQEIIFTSFTNTAITNATCQLTTSYVEANVFCYQTQCAVDRIRPSTQAHNSTNITVIDGLGQLPPYHPPATGFYEGMLGATNSPFKTVNEPYSTPLEYYFTHPDSPYAAHSDSPNQWRGADIYPIGDAVFSQRFSQLLNTFWIASIAPLAVTGNFMAADGSDAPSGTTKYFYQNVTGTMTPDRLELQYRMHWLVILSLTSIVMLLASVAAAVLGALRRGPDVLDRASVIVRHSAYVRVGPASSMEDGFEQVRRLKDVRLYLGDAQYEEERGYVDVGTVDEVVPMSRVKGQRVYE